MLVVGSLISLVFVSFILSGNSPKGNRFCDTGENYLKCSSDCPSGQKDNVCDKVADKICDPDCNPEDDFDCKASLFSSKKFIIGIIFLVVIIILNAWHKIPLHKYKKK